MGFGKGVLNVRQSYIPQTGSLGLQIQNPPAWVRIYKVYGGRLCLCSCGFNRRIFALIPTKYLQIPEYLLIDLKEKFAYSNN